MPPPPNHPVCPEHGRQDERTSTLKHDLDVAFDLIRKNHELIERARQKDREDMQHAFEATHARVNAERDARLDQRATDLKDIADSMKRLSEGIAALQLSYVKITTIIGLILFAATLFANRLMPRIIP